jgi:hypothetical protein
MDLFAFVPSYRIVVCRSCQFVVPPGQLFTHLNTRHRAPKGTLQSAAAVRDLVQAVMNHSPLADPRHETVPRPSPTNEAIPELPTYLGYGCLQCLFVSRKEETIRRHYGREHDNGGYHEKGRRRPQPAEAKGYERMPCQRYFMHGVQSDYFRVSPSSKPQNPGPGPDHIEPARTLSQEEQIRAYVEEQLRQDQIEQERLRTTIRNDAGKTEVSPWLEMTRWPRYLHNRRLPDVAPLAAPADPAREPLLRCFSDSLGRLVDAAYQSISQDKVNAFDQTRINSFIQRQRASDRPLLVKLQSSTYRKYKAVWQRLLCFVYRTAQPDNAIQLSHRLTSTQLVRLDRLIVCSEELLASRTPASASGPETEPSRHLVHDREKLQGDVDRACLSLCIALLDHPLKGDLFESAIVGFLAALGIDSNKDILMEAYSFTPHLSAFVKVSQMLVVQCAVLAVEDGTRDSPADLLDEMRDRFMIHGSRSPFNWALRLRAYGKQVRNSTTSLGYIHWSDDDETLFYKGLELRMTDLREFVRLEVELLQTQLEDLLLLHPDEDRHTVVPLFEARELRDNAANASNGWNFLRDPRNQAVLGPGQRWILDRVLSQSWLQGEFLGFDHCGKVIWRSPAVAGYTARVTQFLRRLLLLCHITSGQPARGTEILSLRHSNTEQGHHRSIFLEDGLVGTVTAYHKGYSISGSTKIIHRYLPNEVGEMLIYYLWLILPFWQHIERLTGSARVANSPFLWPKGRTETWESAELSKVLSQEAQTHLQTSLNITIYRHTAIAISRVHLKSGGFKRDYDAEENRADHQACHGTWTAGTIYARGLQEGPGHVEAHMKEYRRLSQDWHEFLGFRRYVGARKRPLSEVVNESSGRMVRRKG